VRAIGRASVAAFLLASQDPRMVRSMALAWLLVGVVAGCSDPQPSAQAADGTLVLELGGGAPSLRDALRAAGVEVQRAPAVVDASATTGDTTTSPPAEGAGEQPVAPPTTPPAPDANADAREGDDARATPAPPPAAESWIVVTLAEGQTPIHLARKHLGDGNRFREILALNGWTEQDARRLRPGQSVKVPKAANGERAPRR
jgi:nucleoid-associated protein YgaU